MNFPVVVPACPACGANDWVTGAWSVDLVLLRCESCKRVYKPSVEMVKLTETVEPADA